MQFLPNWPILMLYFSFLRSSLFKFDTSDPKFDYTDTFFYIFTWYFQFCEIFGPISKNSRPFFGLSVKSCLCFFHKNSDSGQSIFVIWSFASVFCNLMLWGATALTVKHFFKKIELSLVPFFHDFMVHCNLSFNHYAVFLMLKSQSWNLVFFVPNMASKYRLKLVSSIQAILTIFIYNSIIGTIFWNLSSPSPVESTLYLIRFEQKI